MKLDGRGGRRRRGGDLGHLFGVFGALLEERVEVLSDDVLLALPMEPRGRGARAHAHGRAGGGEDVQRGGICSRQHRLLSHDWRWCGDELMLMVWS